MTRILLGVEPVKFRDNLGKMFGIYIPLVTCLDYQDDSVRSFVGFRRGFNTALATFSGVCGILSKCLFFICSVAAEQSSVFSESFFLLFMVDSPFEVCYTPCNSHQWGNVTVAIPGNRPHRTLTGGEIRCEFANSHTFTTE